MEDAFAVIFALLVLVAYFSWLVILPTIGLLFVLGVLR